MTQSDCDAICQHNRDLILSAAEALARFKQLPMPMRGPAIIKQMIYWENVISALKWSSSIAMQTSKSGSNV